MTVLDINRNTKMNKSLWNENTLKPPLKIKETIMNIHYHWKCYHKNKITTFKRFVFLTLMIFQRISYNLGWTKIKK